VIQHLETKEDITVRKKIEQKCHRTSMNVKTGVTS